MALKRAQAGGGSNDLFLALARPYQSTVVMRIVSQDGTRPGMNNTTYDVVTAHVLVVDGPHQYDFHKNLSITGKGVTNCLVNEDVGDDIVATLQYMPAQGARQEYAAAQPPSDEKLAEVEAMFAEGDPFVHYLGSTASTGNGMTTRPTQTVPPVTTTAKKPPWKK